MILSLLPSLPNALNHVDLLGDCPLHQERQTGTRSGALRIKSMMDGNHVGGKVDDDEDDNSGKPEL